MEMELQQTVLESYRTVVDTSISREEVMESIVPDAYPDVARVISVDGWLCLTGKESSAGAAKLTGTLQMTVLYTPEGGEGVTALTVKRTVQCALDSPQLTDQCQIQASVCAVTCGGHLINPRKLFLKAELRLSLRAFEVCRRTFTCGTGGNDRSVQVREESYRDCAVSAVLEKPFMFSDVLRPSASKPPMDALLFYCVRPDALDVKYIGKRLICKGALILDVLARSGSEIVPASFELPYSQVLDFEGAFEEGEPDAAVAVAHAECSLRDGELEFSVECLLQASLWSSRQVTVLRDLYSTTKPLDVEYTAGTLCAARRQDSRRESARQFVPSDIPARQVLRCTAEVVSLTARDGQCEAEAAVKVLCLSESGTLYSMNWTLPVECETECTGQQECRWQCRCCAVTAVPVTGGLEIRLESEFLWTALDEMDTLCVSAVRERPGADCEIPRPSVVVRPVRDGESLWEIAKANGAAVEDICAVNALAGEELQPGTVLLIPQRRV